MVSPLPAFHGLDGWIKASASGGNDCVGVNLTAIDGKVLVLDTKAPGAGMLTFSREGWAGLLDAVRRGELRP